MAQDLIRVTGVDKTERIRLSGHFYRKARFFAAFLICAAMLVAGFGVSGVWLSRNAGEGAGGTSAATLPSESKPPVQPPSDLPTVAPILPAGAIPICDADLSAASLGNDYINNESERDPDLQALRGWDLSGVPSAEPLVLILHTHTSESYSAAGQIYLEGEIGDLTYSDDPKENVLAVGATLARTLNEKGVTAIHCTVTHDEPTLGGSYARAVESIRFFLTLYPSIRYVIDLHRDSVLNAEGEYLRAVCDTERGRCAQVMAVVGSGEMDDARLLGNLALAQQLRARLNQETPTLCRPTMLKSATYNQELAPYSLLLEIGTGGNSVEEACRSAVWVGEALAAIICGADSSPQQRPE